MANYVIHPIPLAEMTIDTSRVQRKKSWRMPASMLNIYPRRGALPRSNFSRLVSLVHTGGQSVRLQYYSPLLIIHPTFIFISVSFFAVFDKVFLYFFIAI